MIIDRRVLIALFIFLLTISVSAQNYEKNTNDGAVVVQNNRENGDGTLAPIVHVQRSEELNRRIKELTAQFNKARENDDTELIKQLSKQIDDLLGRNAAEPFSDAQQIPYLESPIQTNAKSVAGTSVITSGNVRAIATTTQNTGGRIWVATSNYGNGVTDTLKILYSDNNGDSWVYFKAITFLQAGMDFLEDDLDIEVLRNGSSWWVFVTGGYILSGEKSAFFYRTKDDGTGGNFQKLPQSSSTDQYWARVVSDYPKYTSTAFVYIVATMDSVNTTTTKAVYLRAFTIESPYAETPSVRNCNSEQNGSGYGTWWLGAPLNTVTRSDVAYFDSLGSGDRMITSTIFYTGGSASQIIDLTYSDNFMRGIPYVKQFLSLGGFKHSTPIMSFNGGNDQLKGCIAALRYEGSDVDAVYIATHNGGASWLDGYLDNNYINNTASMTDVIAIKGVDGEFKFGWINTNTPNPEFLYSTGNLNNTGTMSLTVAYSMSGAGVYPDGVYGGRAGYKLGGSDKCFAVFAGQNGSNAYGVGGCLTPVSVEDDQSIPNEYSLDQNYPNPFNPTTTIEYSIPEASFVNIKVYDMLGQKIAELINEVSQQGNYKVNFDAANLPSGTYFYRIKTDKFVEVRKMMLMK
ncbi:MAG: T9SS type A sorting domain-containing protein [Ignavibacteriales bacterium]|nr:MAG: T9SS type A sorting domain-containing protein [Ignavibacteriales bacterium]